MRAALFVGFLVAIAACGDDDVDGVGGASGSTASAATSGAMTTSGGPGNGGAGADPSGSGSGGDANVGGASGSGGDPTGTGGAGGGASCEPENAAYYLAPDGDDEGDGSREQPFRTLMKLWTVIAPGDLVYLRGGDYAFDTQQYLVDVDGTADAPIRIFAHPCEKPNLTRSETWFKPEEQWHRGGIFFSGDHFHWKGIEVSGYAQGDDAQVESGFIAYDASDDVFEGFDVHHNGHGFYMEGSSTGNLVVDSDFHDNFDAVTNGGNADGLSIAYVEAGGTNTVRGCRAWNNSDDGFDNFESGSHVLLENNWAWHNGFEPGTDTPAGNGVGFKLGSVFLSGDVFHGTVLRTLRRNVAFSNRNYGIHQNEGDFRSELAHNVMFANEAGGLNFHFGNTANDFRNNVSFANGAAQVEVSPASTSSHNAAGEGTNDGAWDVIASADDFESLDPTGVDGPRAGDGGLPVLPFLRLAAGSDLVDGGEDLGEPFEGAAPDIGAFERE